VQQRAQHADQCPEPKQPCCDRLHEESGLALLGRLRKIRSVGMATAARNGMAKRQKTAPELERLILLEMRRHAVCAGIAAVTVRETDDRAETNWTVAHINALGGAVPAPCQSVCQAAVAKLQQDYELLPEFELDMDF
jgi:hypothetical protein